MLEDFRVFAPFEDRPSCRVRNLRRVICDIGDAAVAAGRVIVWTELSQPPQSRRRRVKDIEFVAITAWPDGSGCVFVTRFRKTASLFDVLSREWGELGEFLKNIDDDAVRQSLREDVIRSAREMIDGRVPTEGACGYLSRHGHRYAKL